MTLRAIRALAKPRPHAFRRTVLGVLAMAAMVLGLLAMHSSGTAHSDVAVVSAAPTHASHSHGSASAGDVAVASTKWSTATTMVHCDEACMRGAMDCAFMVMGCAMLLAVVSFVLFAHRPGVFRKLLEVGRRAAAALPRSPLHTLRPDLVVLSISQT